MLTVVLLISVLFNFVFANMQEELLKDDPKIQNHLELLDLFSDKKV